MKQIKLLGLEITLLFISTLANAMTVTITVDDKMQFSPKEVTVQAGDTIEFVNTDRFPHSMTADPTKAKNPASVVLPAGANPFDSGLLKQGQKFSTILTVAGNYQYFCTKHEAMGMTGKITVLQGFTEPAPPFACKLSYYLGDVKKEKELLSKVNDHLQVIQEPVEIEGTKAQFYIYSLGYYSSIYLNLLNGSTYLSGAEVASGKTFKLNVSSPPITGVKFLTVTCK